MSNQITIKSLVLKVGSKNIEITIEEAKKLKSVLDELFKTETKEVVKEVIIKERDIFWPPYPQPYYQKPYEITWTEPTYPTVICKVSENNVLGIKI